jgi:hypothetical protein
LTSNLRPVVKASIANKVSLHRKRELSKCIRGKTAVKSR